MSKDMNTIVALIAIYISFKIGSRLMDEWRYRKWINRASKQMELSV